jgi:hypothetical protein
LHVLEAKKKVLHFKMIVKKFQIMLLAGMWNSSLVSINKVLLERSHAQLSCVVYGYLCFRRWVLVIQKENGWPRKPKVFTIWSFTENGYQTPSNQFLISTLSATVSSSHNN